eukprot:359300-Chlamydomonas_euryale.AAC.12
MRKRSGKASAGTGDRTHKRSQPQAIADNADNAPHRIRKRSQPNIAALDRSRHRRWQPRARVRRAELTRAQLAPRAHPFASPPTTHTHTHTKHVPHCATPTYPHTCAGPVHTHTPAQHPHAHTPAQDPYTHTHTIAQHPCVRHCATPAHTCQCATPTPAQHPHTLACPTPTRTPLRNTHTCTAPTHSPLPNTHAHTWEDICRAELAGLIRAAVGSSVGWLLEFGRHQCSALRPVVQIGGGGLSVPGGGRCGGRQLGCVGGRV